MDPYWSISLRVNLTLGILLCGEGESQKGGLRNKVEDGGLFTSEESSRREKKSSLDLSLCRVKTNLSHVEERVLSPSLLNAPFDISGPVKWWDYLFLLMFLLFQFNACGHHMDSDCCFSSPDH